MKANNRFSIILMFFFAAFLVNAQEPQKSEVTPVNSGTKAQDHNSTRSNKTASSAAPDLNQQLEEKSIQNTKPEADPSAKSKKGYEYYQTKSDLNSAKSAKAQDHNSTRSNKTASKIDQGGSSGEGDLNKGIDDKTNKSEAARARKK